MRHRLLPSPLLVLLVASGLLSCAPSEPQIDRASVERVVSTLAADDMEGRQAFTPAADRAAEFLAAEMTSIGLEPLADADGYLQDFTVHSTTVWGIEVELDGVPVPAERLAAMVSQESVEWTHEDDVEVILVGPDDVPIRALGAVRRAGSDALVLLDASHRETFEGWRPFLAAPVRVLEPGEDANLVVVLGEDSAPGALRVKVTAARTEERLANVVGVIPGERADELVLFSAHYDHIGVVTPVDGDAIANGANDDASGTTAVIELARWFRTRGTPERTLVFAAFTAEESGGYGSRHFAGQVDPERIVAMLNIEMIGKVAAEGPRTVWITGFERSDLGSILQQAVDGTEYSFVADPYPDQNLFYRSDNATLARLGVPAHSLSTTPIDVDEDYHQVTDEVGTLDLEHMTDVIRAIALAAAPLVDGEATPTRIDATQVR